MRNGAPILLGAGRYIQGPGELRNLGREAKFYGARALVVAGKTPWGITEERVDESLRGSGITYTMVPFSGYCSESNTDMVARRVTESEADLVIGIGGGRCLDTAKWGANKAGVRCVTVPTSVATCAAYVSLCVLYDDTGSALGPVFADQEVGAVVLDTSIIAQECPPRLFASGIADALAKQPEMFFSMLNATDWERSVLPEMGAAVADFNTARYSEKAVQALDDVARRAVTPAVEDVACLNVMLTGLVSCLASGGKQLAIAHSLYDGITRHFKTQNEQFRHGEIVSCGLAVQMGVNGYDERRIDEFVGFLKRLGTPTTLRDIDIEPTDQNIETLLDFVFTNMDISDEAIRASVRKNMERIR